MQAKRLNHCKISSLGQQHAHTGRRRPATLQQQQRCRPCRGLQEKGWPIGEASAKSEFEGTLLARRQLLHCIAASLVLAQQQLAQPPPAAAGLAQFPASELKNRYILVRAGESESETQDAMLTNPVWKQSGMAGLSSRGKVQVVRQTLPAMETLGVCGEAGCWIWPSITLSTYQTAEIMAGSLGVGRSRIVPEYSFLDARGVGALDGLRVATAAQQVLEGDLLDATWRPPKGYDGTPNESAADVLTHMRQLMSICETQYSGEDVVIVAPDSDTLSILQAAVLGVDLRQHRQLGFRPGEVRVLLLSDKPFDTAPMSLPCPKPPACR